jgi:hypothetical protein
VTIGIEGPVRSLRLNLARSEATNAAGIVGLSVLGGLVATLLIPHFISWLPYDYSVYIKGARMIREGLDPHALLPYWYPLPVTLFTTVPLSFLPDQFAWAFAFIPLGLLHLRFGRNAVLWWLFFPLLINVAFAQAEGWLILALFWLLEDAPFKSSLGVVALMFKPAYGMFLAPYRVGQWVRARQWKSLAGLAGLSGVMMGAAFLVDQAWPLHWLNSVLRRGDNPELRMRNMTVWAFGGRGELGLASLGLLLALSVWIVIPLLRAREPRGQVLLALSLFFFPGGLNPVSSMMVIPLIETRNEILLMVAASWLAAGLDVVVGGFGGVYLIIVLTALYLRRRRFLASKVLPK